MVVERASKKELYAGKRPIPADNPESPRECKSRLPADPVAPCCYITTGGGVLSNPLLPTGNWAIRPVPDAAEANRKSFGTVLPWDDTYRPLRPPTTAQLEPVATQPHQARSTDPAIPSSAATSQLTGGSVDYAG